MLTSKLKYIFTRLLECLVSLVFLSFIIFSLLYLAPGDPAKSLVGVKHATPELLAKIHAQYHLDDPFLSQYGRWVKNALSLDFGNSIKAGYPVVDYVAPHAAITFELVGLTLLLSVIIGVWLGVVSARNKGKILDKAIDLSSLAGTSMPGFALGLVLLYVFSYQLGIFPMYGIGDKSNPLDVLWHLTLPAITLTIGDAAMLIKITRSAMLKEVSGDYTVFMRARALPTSKIIRAQLKNASPPILTSTGLFLASLFGANVLVENVFSIPGLGQLLTSSVTFGDVPVVQFIALMLAVLICLTSALVDILVYLLNPNTHQLSQSTKI
ncbi:MAG: ABC transporter permease [Oscillospiraceae bacterium]|jgi:peptide/nickel transport system permease protein|nr:ABC transporter permease [Oscillospiraceae bacterium]